MVLPKEKVYLLIAGTVLFHVLFYLGSLQKLPLTIRGIRQIWKHNSSSWKNFSATRNSTLRNKSQQQSPSATRRISQTWKTPTPPPRLKHNSSSRKNWSPTRNYTLRNKSQQHLPTVTRRIHQTWKTHALPPRFKRYSSSWQRCFPTWKHTLWNDTENRELIRVQFPWFLETYDAFPDHIHRVDAVRYFLLYSYGGVYSDLDGECLRPFEHLLGNYSLVLGGMEGGCGADMENWCVQNSFMYSQPNHPVWMEVAHEMMQLVKKGQHKRRAEFVTGPMMMVSVFHRVLRSYPQHTWKVYPPQYFNPFSWVRNSQPAPSACKGLNAMSEAESMQCRDFFMQKNHSYVVQYHTQTWLAGKILK